jgi:hypothetical protein
MNTISLEPGETLYDYARRIVKGTHGLFLNMQAAGFHRVEIPNISVMMPVLEYSRKCNELAEWCVAMTIKQDHFRIMGAPSIVYFKDEGVAALCKLKFG